MEYPMDDPGVPQVIPSEYNIDIGLPIDTDITHDDTHHDIPPQDDVPIVGQIFEDLLEVEAFMSR